MITKEEKLISLINYASNLNMEDYCVNSWRELETALKNSKHIIKSINMDLDIIVATEILKKSIENLSRIS